MEEDKKNEEVNNSEFKVEIDKEELKNQTKDTVNQFKDTIKNVNIKNDANAAKTFVLEMIKKPFTTINNIVSEKENGFSSALILMIILLIAFGLEYIIRVVTNEWLDFHFGAFIENLITPLIYVLAFSVAVFLFGGKNKKKIPTILAGLTVAYLPRVLGVLMDVIYSIIDIRLISYLNTIISNTAAFLSIALTFIAIKGLITNDGDEDKIFRKVSIIVVVAFVILQVLSICGIY